jgi:hypothetical protein
LGEEKPKTRAARGGTEIAEEISAVGMNDLERGSLAECSPTSCSLLAKPFALLLPLAEMREVSERKAKCLSLAHNLNEI